MKSLFHFISLIIYISTSNSLLSNDLRENVLQLMKGSFLDVSRTPKEPSFDNDQFDPLPDKHSLRNGIDENLGEDFDPYNSPMITRGIVDDDDATDLAPKLKLVKRKRKKGRAYHNDGAPPAMANIPYENEEQDKQLRYLKDIEEAQSKAKILRNAKNFEDRLNGMNLPYSKTGALGKQRYHMDPLLNLLRSGHRRKSLNTRRKSKESEDESSSSDSSADELNWKEEWKLYWAKKKYEALNSTVPPDGDNVAMVGSRPWGVHCGDPNQHDMPWGSCMLSAECEPEYRIYRGDFLCGRTEFVCCGIYLTNYDLYQGIDASFDDKSLSTDTEEKHRAGQSSEKASKKKAKEKQKRKRDRIKRKKAIKKNIRKIVKEIRKILDNQYKNGTKQRQKKTKTLKKFVKHLKKQYKKDRNSIKEIHEEQMMKIDAALQEKLNQLRAVNEEFMKNDTFRDIIINGTITKTGARMLIEAYPELVTFIHTRRNARAEDDKSSNEEDYDVEYGYLYY